MWHILPRAEADHTRGKGCVEMDEITVPIYLMAGFLESGKTSFLNFTIEQDYFQIDLSLIHI